MNESPLLSRILAGYDLRVVRHEHLRTSENRVERIEADDGQSYVVRIRRILGDYRERIQSELEVLRDYGAVARGNTPAPLPARDGRLYVEVAHEGAGYLGVVFRWVPGKHVGGQDLTCGHMAAMARAVGDFHGFARGYAPSAGFDRPVYDEEWFFGRDSWRASCPFLERLGTEQVEPLRSADAAVESRLRQQPRGAETFGLIHYDLHAGNFLFHDGVANMIDFDECGWGWYLFDLAHILFEFVEDPRFSGFKSVVAEGYAGAGAGRSYCAGELDLFLALQGIAYLNWLNRILLRDGNTEAMVYWVPVLLRRFRVLVPAMGLG